MDKMLAIEVVSIVISAVIVSRGISELTKVEESVG